jgi:hypothetical protein
MSSTDPNNNHMGSEQGADTTGLPFFGPPTADVLRSQIHALVDEKEKEKPVFDAEYAKVIQDYEAALANNADPETLRHHEEPKEKQTVLYAQFLGEYIELVKQFVHVNKEA